MSNINELEVCLICTQQDNIMISLQEVLVRCQQLTVSEVLEELNFLTIPDSIKFHRNICFVCLSKIQYCFEFKVLCYQIEESLKTLTENACILNLPNVDNIKQEILEENNLEDNNEVMATEYLKTENMNDNDDINYENEAVLENIIQNKDTENVNFNRPQVLAFPGTSGNAFHRDYCYRSDEIIASGQIKDLLTRPSQSYIITNRGNCSDDAIRIDVPKKPLPGYEDMLNANVLPNFPITNFEDLCKFNELLSTSERAQIQFIKLIRNRRLPDLKKTVRSVFSHIVDDNLCISLSWSGQRNTISVKRTKFVELLISTVAGEKESIALILRSAIQRWLKHANGRVKYKEEKRLRELGFK